MRNQHAPDLTELTAEEMAAVSGGDLVPVNNGFGDLYNWFVLVIAGTSTGGSSSGSGSDAGTDPNSPTSI